MSMQFTFWIVTQPTQSCFVAGAIEMKGAVNDKGVYEMEVETFMNAFDSANNISTIRIFKPFW